MPLATKATYYILKKTTSEEREQLHIEPKHPAEDADPTSPLKTSLGEQIEGVAIRWGDFEKTSPKTNKLQFNCRVSAGNERKDLQILVASYVVDAVILHQMLTNIVR